ncbi:hypothetical protein PALB_35360 [Pseudoalteromonas luteoviolacea B = ATCC 29581]|nr:hypothetical protein PALB_35360 [Pseudoalteromonas luteoviolacea B = ATCC 29581]
MKFLELETYTKHARWIGLFAIIACIAAWAVELSGLVYVCPYCRVQRTVIGFLGVILVTPLAWHWIAKYVALVVGFFGLSVAADQHFMGWKKISAGTFEFNQNLAADPFILSGLALTFITALVFLILQSKQVTIDS